MSHNQRFNYYEGRSINKLQNGAIALIHKIGKMQSICFVGNLVLNIHRNFFKMTSPPVFYHNAQVINIKTRKNK